MEAKMTSKEYLSQVSNIDNRIKDLLKEATRWYDIATSTGSSDMTQPKVQSSPNLDRIGDVVGKVVDYQRKCIELAEEKTELKHTIIEQIKSLKGEKGEIYYNLLYGHYVDKKGLGELAVEHSYSYRQTLTLYNQGLSEFEKRYGSQYLDIDLMEYSGNFT